MTNKEDEKTSCQLEQIFTWHFIDTVPWSKNFLKVSDSRIWPKRLSSTAHPPMANIHCIFVSWWKSSMKFYYFLYKETEKDSMLRLKIFFMYERLLLLTVRWIFASWPESTEPLKEIQWIFAIVKRPVGEIRVSRKYIS